MISAPTLLKDLQKWVKSFEDDLRERCKEVPELDAHLKSQYDAARIAKRTGHPYGTWRDEALTQSAVAWVLACTFVRFLEDNDLLETPFLSGPGELRELAGETRAAYFREHRAHSDDDYLRHVFRQVATLPGMGDLFDARHNELWNAGISGDAAKSFIEFWRKIDPNTGRLTHDFSVTTGVPSHPPSTILVPQLSFSLAAGDSSHPPSTINDPLSPQDPTRFLGDLYQSLSESARKRFALLQTPDFIEECFWLKQVCHDKGGGGIGGGIASEPWEHRFAHNATQVANLPIPATELWQLPSALVKYSAAIAANFPPAAIATWGAYSGGGLLEVLETARCLCEQHRRKLIAWQEELDWQIYEAYGLIEAVDAVSQPEGAGMDGIPPDGITLGQRAFEIVLARRMAAGEVQTTWFARHGSTPITELPAHWPTGYRELVERRIHRTETDPNIRLIEQPEYKRRWNTEPWDKQQQNALERWLLDRLETYFHDSDRMVGTGGQKSEVRDQEEKEEELKIEIPDDVRAARGGHEAGGDFQFTTVQRLAAAAMRDPKFMEAAAVYTDEAGFQVAKLVEKLVLSAAVPFLPAQRYKDSGLRKRLQWEDTWNLQRREDAIDAEEKTDETGLSDLEKHQRLERAANRKKTEIGDIPVPPKYTSADFKKASWWSHRGKLDVPKERFILYPGAEGGWDDSPVIAWAGWDHAQQARALCGYYQQALENWAWPETKLAPLLAGLADLLPWLHQWHHAIDPEFHEPLATIYQAYYHQQRHALRLTDEQIEAVRMGE